MPDTDTSGICKLAWYNQLQGTTRNIWKHKMCTRKKSMPIIWCLHMISLHQNCVVTTVSCEEGTYSIFGEPWPIACSLKNTFLPRNRYNNPNKHSARTAEHRGRRKMSLRPFIELVDALDTPRISPMASILSFEFLLQRKHRGSPIQNFVKRSIFLGEISLSLGGTLP